jgi:DNA-binding SARP family transcriptional activator
VDGHELALGPPLQRAVFAVLAVRANQVVYSSELIDAVWGDRLPGSPQGGVHTYVAGLRRVLDPDRARRASGRYLESRSLGYRLNAPDGSTDLARFEGHRERGRRAWKAGALDEADAEFGGALALFEGSALGGVPGPYAAAKRAALAEQRLAVLEDRIDVLLAQGRHAETIDQLRVLTAEHPLRERPWAQLMLALYRSGRQADALAAFEAARGAAVGELGLDPGPLLAALRQRIVVGDPALSPGAGPAGGGPHGPPAAEFPRTLPRDTDHFTGRRHEVAALLAMADGPNPPVCSIDGMAGIGKTTLAVHLARRLGERYPDAQLYLDLHGHARGQQPMTAAAALDKLLLAVGVPGGEIPAQIDDRTALWRSRLAGRRSLLVLDNAVDASQVRPLLPGAPGTMVLITSRRRLTGLDDGCFLSLDVLSPADAAELFAAAAGRSRAAAEPEATAAVVHACGYLPLAIRIAAARLRHRPSWQIAHLARRLDGEEQRLAELETGDRSVTAAFALSYRYLDEDRQRVFRLLGLFPGAHLDAHAAAALAGGEAGPTDRCLQDLVDAHLLDEPEPERYRLHDLLSVFAARQCREEELPEARHAALGRLLDFYLHTIDGAEQHLRPKRLDRAPAPGPRIVARRFADRAGALAWLDAERGNFVPVVRIAAENGFHHHAWQIARYLWGFYETRRHWADWTACYELALPSARQVGDRLAQARLLVGLGVTSHDLRRYDDAVTRYREALALMRETGFRSGEAGVLTNLGNTYRRMGKLADSIACQEQSQQICRDVGDRTGEAIALANLGELYRDDERFAESIGVQEQALAMFREWGDRRVEGTVLDGLARTYLAMRAYGQAFAHCRAALASRRETGDRYGEAETLDCLGQLHRVAGRRSDAAGAWRAALAIAEELDAPSAGDLRNRLAEVEVEAKADVVPAARIFEL